MHRARSAYSVALSPARQRNLSNWLVQKNSESKVSCHVFSSNRNTHKMRTQRMNGSGNLIFGAILQVNKDAITLSAVRNYSVADKPSLDGTSSSYVEEMYNSWLRDPASVHTVSLSYCRRRSNTPIVIAVFFSPSQSWDAYFRSNTYCSPPSLAPHQPNHVPLSQVTPFVGGGSAVGRVEPDEKTIDDHLAVQAIIRSYQVRLTHHNHSFCPTYVLSLQSQKKNTSKPYIHPHKYYTIPSSGSHPTFNPKYLVILW